MNYLFAILVFPLFLFTGISPVQASASLSETGDEIPPLAQAQQKAEHESVVGKTTREKATFDKFVREESRFKDHYQSHYATSGYDYNQYRPAYQHGFELALDPRYAKQDWSGVELQARRTWDESTMGLWDQYKDAVRYGWEQGVALERG